MNDKERIEELEQENAQLRQEVANLRESFGKAADAITDPGLAASCRRLAGEQQCALSL